VADELDESLIEVQTNLAPFCHEVGISTTAPLSPCSVRIASARS